MAFKYAGESLAVNYVYDPETKFQSQTVYELVLEKKWNKIDPDGEITDYDFIESALYYLPKNSFIIFNFSEDSNHFVQCGILNNSIFIDLPYKYEGIYHNRRKDLVEILHKLNIRRIYRLNDSVVRGLPNFEFTDKRKNSKGSMQINLYDNYLLATRLIILIYKTLTGIETPMLYKYETDRFLNPDSI